MRILVRKQWSHLILYLDLIGPAAERGDTAGYYEQLASVDVAVAEHHALDTVFLVVHYQAAHAVCLCLGCIVVVMESHIVSRLEVPQAC